MVVTFISCGAVKLCPIGLPLSSSRCDLRAQAPRNSFFGHFFPVTSKIQKRRDVTNMTLDPWSVSPELADVLAAQAFAASLFPYLVFLYFLGKDEVKCPKLALFGFQFLLAFVGCTIPAGIYAKVHYGDILANIDWLHGSAESLLTLTNLLIVLGFRTAFKTEAESTVPPFSFAETRNSAIASVVSAIFLSIAVMMFPPGITEPANALSFPTWIIHISSILEWLFAMKLVWNYADLSGNERWRGLTIAMILLHTSGLVACTYHFFYNATSLNILVTLQAALTFCGNSALAFAAYRIFRSASEKVDMVQSNSPSLKLESEPAYLFSLLASSAIGSAFIKWGELYLHAPFDPSLALALSMILIPTLVNVVKWLSTNPSNVSDAR